MKTVYVGVPKQYVGESDAVAIALREIPGAHVRPVSVPHLVIEDLSGQVSNPPDDLIAFWEAEQRRFDRNYWVGRFFSYASTAKSVAKHPYIIIMLAGCDDDPTLCLAMDIIYSGGLETVVREVEAEIESRFAGGKSEWQ